MEKQIWKCHDTGKHSDLKKHIKQTSKPDEGDEYRLPDGADNWAAA